MNTLNHTMMPDYPGLAKTTNRGHYNTTGGFPSANESAAKPVQPANVKPSEDLYKPSSKKAAPQAAPKLPRLPEQPKGGAKRRILRNLFCG
jgi:hypothetical protein